MEETSNVPNSNASSSKSMQAVPVEDPIRNMINEAFGADRHHSTELDMESNEESGQGEQASPQVTTEKPLAKEFYELGKYGEEPLYEGCTKYSRLSFLVKLYHIKCFSGMSDKAMSMILELLQDAFEYAKVPSSFYEMKKTMVKLGLDYEKIHACPNNCMIYWGADDENRQTCKVCNRSRWKSSTKDSEVGASNEENTRKKVPAKVVRYFPLKPRLQRLFLSSKTAEDMKWHHAHTSGDDNMRHPRDSEAWKRFDSLHPSFASEPRNVRLALATDGFNPYGSMSTSYSIWPIVLIPYNTPPWICMKPSSFILSTIIPGKRMPGNDIDIYLQPLIKELNGLWHEGVDAYDASTKEMFKLHAALMWMISDFPGLGTLSGWNTYTGFACPSCHDDFDPERLDFSKKWCFMGHRRFLDRRHRFRLNRVRFDGKQDLRDPPNALSGTDVLEKVRNINVTFGRIEKVREKRKRGEANEQDIGHATKGKTQQWKKKSIFFELPYWQYNLLRHNLDVMHIEKNVCDNIIYTLLNDSAESKDHLNARKDLKKWGVRQELWPEENGKYPLAVYSLTKQGRKAFLSTLKNITIPDGYSSDIFRCIDEENAHLNGVGGVHYYGKLVDIIELNYNGLFTVPLFKCEWANTTVPRGTKTDKLGFTSIDFSRIIHSSEHADDEPYIKATEAQMVYYVEDEKEKGWCIPITLKPRDLYQMSEDVEEIMADDDSYPTQDLEQIFSDISGGIQLARAPSNDDE